MVKRLKKYCHLIRVFSKLDPKTQENILKKPDKDFIRLISEICFNIQKKNVILKDSDVKKLKKFAKYIKLFQSKSVSVRKKRSHILKGAGFLPVLFSVIAPLLTALIR